ncbi:MAG TPA: ABC transporter permease subunit [Bacillales bacterium]|nr:ABC transporter permease subunit [Bacillales bacterium]
MLKTIQQLVIVVILVIFVTGLPLSLHPGPNFQSIEFHPMNIWDALVNYAHNFSEEPLGTYEVESERGTFSQERSVAEDILPYAVHSFVLILCSLLIAVTVTLLFGVIFTRSWIAKVVRSVMDTVAVIPDFVFIVLSVFVAVQVYQWTGIRVLTLSTQKPSAALWFPILILSFAPTLYLLKLLYLKHYQVAGEDYVRTALAKGMGKLYINFQHIFKNVKPFLVADLKKTISLTVGNLFIVEYLLNVQGLTYFIFFDRTHYEFQTTMSCLFIILFEALIVYGLVRLFLYLFEKVFVHE